MNPVSLVTHSGRGPEAKERIMSDSDFFQRYSRLRDRPPMPNSAGIDSRRGLWPHSSIHLRPFLRYVLCLVFLIATACGDEPLTVAPPPVPTSIEVTPASTVLAALGDTVRLVAEVLDQNGQALTGVAVTWTTSDSGVATVNSTGLVTAVANGSATVTATAGTVSATSSLTVSQIATHLRLTPEAATLVALQDALRLTTHATDGNTHTVEMTDYLWSSSDTLVAGVDTVGVVIAVANGLTEIAATAGLLRGTAMITVAQEPKAMEITPAAVDLNALGDTVRLIAKPLDANSHLIANPRVAWSSSDPAIAAVDSSGLVTSLQDGVTTITASLPPVTAAATVTVAQKALRARVTPVAAALELLGDTLRLAADALDANDSLVAGFQFVWISDDTSVALVNEAGLVTGTGSGTTWITASSGSLAARSAVTVAKGDRGVLITLYHATGGANWKRDDNWLTDTPLNSWYGVGAHGADVSKVDLDNNGLAGTIPSALGNLASLQYLSLWQNKLTGPIPPQLGTIQFLSGIDLGGNALSGSVPAALGNLQTLYRLNLGSNELTGTIPPELGNLRSLHYLSLRYNNLHGPIPPELGNLVFLQRLNLYGNNRLSGPIPLELTRLTRLRELSLGSNQLTGQIPPELAKLSDLERLGLGPNGLSGPIPLELGKLHELTYLDLSSDYALSGLSGSIPPELGNLVKLEELDLSFNSLSGVIPTELGRLEQLRILRLRSNELTALIPSQLAALTSLEVLDLGSNRLLGSIPAWVGDFHNLTALVLNHNMFTGSVPIELAKLKQLRSLGLEDNGLSGPVPAELGNLSNLRHLIIASNRLKGVLPMELTKLELRWFIWNNNSGLCAPSDSVFQAWLENISLHKGGPTCSGSAQHRTSPDVYLRGRSQAGRSG